MLYQMINKPGLLRGPWHQGDAAKQSRKYSVKISCHAPEYNVSMPAARSKRISEKRWNMSFPATKNDNWLFYSRLFLFFLSNTWYNWHFWLMRQWCSDASPRFVLLVSTTMPTALWFVLCESSVALGTVLGSLAPHTHISKEGCQDKFQVNLYSPTLGISKINRHSSMLWKRWNWLFYIRFFSENYTGTSPSLHPAPKKARPVRVPPWVFHNCPMARWVHRWVVIGLSNLR